MAIGVFGGTFDPVHIGHLRAAIELRDSLRLDTLRLMPSADPVHRQAPEAGAEHRLAMLRLAVANEPALVADDLEIRRGGATYTIDTLEQLRSTLGDDQPLLLCIGMDSLASLDSWKHWQSLTDLAHIVVAGRPGWQPPAQGALAEWVGRHRVDAVGDLNTRPAGCLYFADIPLLPVSSTGIRDDLRAGRSVRYLTPDAVIDYIHDYHLYGTR